MYWSGLSKKISSIILSIYKFTIGIFISLQSYMVNSLVSLGNFSFHPIRTMLIIKTNKKNPRYHNDYCSCQSKKTIWNKYLW